ncbi:MAG: helix-hairpin-helix domain-containing protein [Armatimonadaceae bacterium]
MTDTQIARRFRQIGDILEIKGENPFKIKAYRTACDTIDALEDNLADIDARGELQNIPGFGPAIVGKTREFLTTGTCELWEKIKSDVPAGVIQMAGIRGVGPKVAAQVHKELGIDTIDALEAAAQNAQLQALSGFGAAKEKKLLDAIAAWRRIGSRVPLWKALPFAARVSRVLLASGCVSDVQLTGEARRGMDTLSCVCFVVAGDDLGAAVNKLLAQGWFDSEPSVAANNAVTGIIDEMPVHFSLVPTITGNVLLTETGPEPFVEWIASQLPNGLADVFASEEALFRAAELQFIDPEIRDHIEDAARVGRGELRLVTLQDFTAQLHEHTTWSDGRNSISEMADEAISRGWSTLGITDHSASLTVARGLTTERHIAQFEELSPLQIAYAEQDFALLAGLEADILQDGSLDCAPEILSQLHYVVASVHIRYKETEAQMTERMCTAIAHPKTRILGHPTGRLLGRREGYAVDLNAVIDAAIKHNVAIEINAGPERMDLCDEWVRVGAGKGAKFSINADAHAINHFDWLPYGLAMARRAGLTKEQVVNCWEPGKLVAWLLRI